MSPVSSAFLILKSPRLDKEDKQRENCPYRELDLNIILILFASPSAA